MKRDAGGQSKAGTGSGVSLYEIVRPWRVPGLAARLHAGRSLARAWLEVLTAGLELHGTVLDFGGGGSGLASQRAGAAARVHAVDLRAEAGPSIIGDGERGVPVKSGACDTVLLFNVLEHVYAAEHLVGELVRTLRPGGRILIFVPYLFQRHTARHGSIVVEDFHRFGPARLRRLLIESGCLGAVRIHALDGGPFTAAAHAVAAGLPIPALRPLVYHAGMFLDRITVERRAVREARDEWPLAYWVEAER